MDVVALATAGLNAIGSALGLWGKHQDRKNTPAQKANVDAKRDMDEREHVESTIEKSERTGDLDEERNIFS